VALPSLAEHPRHDRRRIKDIDPCSHPAGASGHKTSAGAVPLVKNKTFLNELIGSVHRLAESLRNAG